MANEFSLSNALHNLVMNTAKDIVAVLRERNDAMIKVAQINAALELTKLIAPQLSASLSSGDFGYLYRVIKKETE